jgi:hypothetical protein
LDELRSDYHRRILEKILGRRRKKGKKTGKLYYSNADSGNAGSMALSEGVALKLTANTGQEPCQCPPMEQTAGTVFASLTKDFLDKAFRHLQHLRPGNWTFSTSQEKGGITKHFQYEHLADLQAVLEDHPELRATLGGDYLVVPDITISRQPVDDAEINTVEKFVSEAEQFGKYTPLRASVNPKSILHASVSCKWTIRSDRSQNTRTEALNLIRNRKGKVPIVVAVVFEPLPTRIASVALGTGDLDCVYHGALHELREAIEELGNEDQKEMLDTLVQGRRLRDISDLPFDLAT